jgi:hypothetical protein
MSTLNGPGEGTWSVFAAKVVEERDRLRGVCDLRLHIMERLEKERDEARAELSTLRKDYDSVLEANVGLLDDAPWADVRRAYIRGAEAMREACAVAGQEACASYIACGEVVAETLRALPIPEEP